jgi:zinc-ribbon family
MIILFGIRRRAQRLAIVLQLCSNCRTPAAQAVTRIRTFFTLFFIPIVPLGSRYITTCTLCGAATKITKEHADHLIASAQAQSAGPPPRSSFGQPLEATPQYPAPQFAAPPDLGSLPPPPPPPPAGWENPPA